jgi:hypothetical protein
MRITAVQAVTELSPFLRHFLLSMTVPPCYNPIENDFQLAAYFL